MHEAPGAYPGAPSEMSASAVWKAAQAPAPTAQSIRLQEEEMQQTWAQLMRNGAVKPSAAMALVVRARRHLEWRAGVWMARGTKGGGSGVGAAIASAPEC